MKHLSRRVAVLVLASAPAFAQGDANYPTGAANAAMQDGRSEFVMPQDTTPTAPTASDAVSLPPAVPLSTPVPEAAPAKTPSAIVPAEQAPAPVTIAPTGAMPAQAPVAPAMKPAAPRAHAIPLITTKQHVEVHADVTYITGGIGDDELDSIKASKADYNLYVMSASLNGAFVGDSHVTITNKAGEVMLDVVAGPLLYVKLPAGSYTLAASLGEQKKSQAFTIGKKSATANVHLGWKVDATLSN